MAFGAKIKLSVNTSGKSVFRTEIQKYVNEATKSNPIKIAKVTVKISNPKTQLNLISKQLNEAGGITVKLKEVNAKAAINKLRSDIQYMLSGLNIVGLKEFLKTDDIDKAANSINKVKQSASEWASQMKVVNDIQNKLGSTYKSALSGNQMITDTAKMSGITTEYTKWQQKVEALRNSKVALSANTLAALQQEGIAIQQNITSEQRKQAEQVRSANTSKKSSAENAANAKREIALTQQVVSLKAQIQRYILSNSKAYKLYKNEINALLGSLKIDSGMTVEKLRQIKTQFTEIQISARNAGKTGNSFFNTLKKGWEKFGGWSLVTRSMMTAYRTIKNMVVAVRELDTAMTELKKVTDLSEESYRNYLTTATQTSKQIGASLSNTVSATADFARLGYDIGESASLAEAALIYKNVGDGIDDISEASESLISTIKAFEQFGITANDSMNIIDKFNEVGNNFAISSEGIGIALQKSASSLASANNNLDESIALITAMNAVVQNPEVVGTALKTVSMYLRAAKTEAEEAGEITEGMANSVSALREQLLTLTNNKVDIMIDDNTFKSTYQIMKELSSVWNELSDVDTANILNLIGGKRNATAVTSLITNFKDAEAALKTSMNAMGSATAENEKYLDSINGKLNILKSTFEDLSQSIIDSEFIKLIVSSVTKLISFLDILVDKFGALPVLVTSASMGLSVFGKGIKVFSVAEKELAIFGSKISDISDRFKLARSSGIGFFGSLLSTFDTDLNSKSVTIDDYNRLLNDSIPKQRIFMQYMEGTNSTLAGYLKSLNGTQASLKGFHEYAVKAGVQAGVLSIKSKLAAVGVNILNTALQTAIGIGITLLIQGLVTAITSASKAMEEAASKAKELSEQSKSLANTQQQIIKLKESLNDVNTTESEAVSIREQLYEIQNNLIEQYGTEASKIDLVRDSVDSLNTSLQSLDSSKLKEWYLDDPKSAAKAVKSIYGKGSINSWGANTGKEEISISEDINGYDLTQIQHIFTSRIGGDNWTKRIGSEGLYAGDYTLEIGKSVKESGGTKKDLVDKYSNILEDLEQVLTKAQNEGRADTEITAVEELISKISKAKNYWADDKYDEEYATANEYAKYLVSQNIDQNRAYTALQKAETDYKNAQTSGSEEDIELAYRNYRLAAETIQEITDSLGKTGNEGAIRDFLGSVVEGAFDNLSRDDFVLKFKADEEGIKTSLQNAIESFGSGKSVRSSDIINFNPYATINKGTDRATAFYEIKSMADKANVSLETYVGWLTEVGVIQEEVSDTSKKLDFSPILDMNTESMKSLSESLDNVQSSFASIKSVIDDYNKTGILSIDNLQKLLELDDKYIEILFDENGNLTLNEQAYQNLTKAKLENIKVDMLKNTIDNIKKIQDEESALDYLEQQYNDTAKATQNYTEAILNSYVTKGILKGGKIKEAVLDIYNTYKQYATLIENTDTTWAGNTDATNAQTKALEKQKEALENVNKEQEAIKENLESQKEALEDIVAEYEDSQSKINNLIDLTVDMLKQKYEDEKEIIEKNKDAYKDKVDALKESLEEEKDAYDKHQSIYEKKNDVSTLQRQLASLQGTTSVEGKQRLAEIQKELSEATQDLHDTQYENSISDRQDALDQEYERKEKLWDKEIKRIEEVVGNERQLRIQAMSLIDTKSNEFYNDLWGYVYKYTTKSRFEFNTLWSEAYSALDKYNFGQFTCIQIMDLLEQNIYNTGLQIDALESHISNVSTAIESNATAIDIVSKSIENLTEKLNAYNSIDLDEKLPLTYPEPEPNSIEIPLGGGKIYSTTDKSRLASSILIWRQWKQDYDNGQTDRTTYTIQDVYNAILKKYPEGQLNHYASGTRSSKSGLSIVDEDGSEFILSQPKKGRYANLDEGSVVFTKEQTENLWNLSQYKSPSQEFLELSDKFSKMISGNYDAFVVRNQFDNYVSDSKNLPISQNSMSNANNSVSLPINITIHNTNGLNEKRLATELKNDIFREFRKYGSWLG